MTIFISALIGYLLGSIPFGLLLTKYIGKVDVREIGSGNIGATNVLRSGRKDLAIATLLLDGLKGTLAVYLCTRYFGAQMGLLAGFFAFIGHIFPVWLKFKGGKGVATFFGVLLALHWPAFLICVGIWILVAFISRYSSLAALVAAGFAPIVLFLLDKQFEGMVFLVITFLIFFKHYDNLIRLMEGNETKIGS